MTAHLVEKLSPYLDGELSPNEAAAVQAHLRDCADCSLQLEGLAAVDDLARGLVVEAPGGYFDSFPARLREKLPARAPAPRRLPLWTLAAAAVLLVAVVTPLTLRQRSLGPSVAEMPRALEPQTASSAAPQGKPQDPLRGLGYVEGPSPRGADADREGRRTNAFRAAPSSQPGPAAGSAEKDALAKQAPPPPPAPLPAAPPLTLAEAAPPQGPGIASRRAAPAAASPRGPWFQSQSQGQSPGAFVPPPSGQPEARKDEPGLEDKATAEVAARPEKEIQPALERGVHKPGVGATGVAESASGAPGGKGKAAVGFEALRARRARSAEEARALREAWQRFAADNPSDPRADEARVAGIEAAALVFRLGHQPADRVRTETDAKAYLGRPDAVQADRVMALLASLGR